MFLPCEVFPWGSQLSSFHLQFNFFPDPQNAVGGIPCGVSVAGAILQHLQGNFWWKVGKSVFLKMHTYLTYYHILTQYTSITQTSVTGNMSFLKNLAYIVKKLPETFSKSLLRWQQQQQQQTCFEAIFFSCISGAGLTSYMIYSYVFHPVTMLTFPRCCFQMGNTYVRYH